MKEFEEVLCHDAEIVEILIERSEPGIKDQVIIEAFSNNLNYRLVFEECYKVSLDLNMGVIAPESILSAKISKGSKELSSLKEKWKLHGVDLSKLKEFKINTNSTNSDIIIFAKKCEIFQK